MRKLLSTISLTIIILITSGCGSLLCNFGQPGKYIKCEIKDGVYRATRHDIAIISSPFFPLAILDFPIALLSDTLLLPHQLGDIIENKYYDRKLDNEETILLKDTLSELNKLLPLNCTDGVEPKIKRWSYGYERFCEIDNQKDGPWDAWFGQKIRIKGAYKQGLAHGEWIYLNSDGTIKCSIGYSEGNVLSKEIIKTLKEDEDSNKKRPPWDWVTEACGIVKVPESVKP